MILQNGDMLSIAVFGAFAFIVGWIIWLLVALLSRPRRK